MTWSRRVFLSVQIPPTAARAIGDTPAAQDWSAGLSRWCVELFPLVCPAPQPVSVEQGVCECGGEEDGAGGECPDPAGGGHREDGVLPAVRDGTGEVAVGVDVDGDGLPGLRGVSVGTAPVRSPRGVVQRARAVFWVPTGRIA